MKKHIVILTPGFPVNEEDSTCIPALQIFVKELAKINTLKVSIVTLYYPKIEASYFWNGTNVKSLGLSLNKGSKLFSLYKASRLLKSIHAKQSIDIIHSFWLGECAFLGHLFSKKHKINTIVTLMGQDAKNKNIFSRLLPLKQMDLVSLSFFHHQTLLNSFNVTSKIIPWGINTKNAIACTSKKSIDIIGIGSLIPLKNYSQFIEIISNLKISYPKIKVVIVGSGKECKALLKKIKTSQLENQIKLVGELSYIKTQELLSKSKILLHTSNYESFGMVFAEALLHKAYIVSKPVGIAKESDFWFVGDTEKELIKGCKKMLLKDKMAEAELYTIDDTVNSYLNLYNA